MANSTSAPQPLARLRVVEVGGSIAVAAATKQLSGPPFHLDGGWEARPAPRVGEHTDEVLRELGYSTVEPVR